MAKVKTKYVCQNCGYETPKYIGRCPDCGSWGSLEEEIEKKELEKSSLRTSAANCSSLEACLIDEIEITENIRTSSGFKEFDRVLGGGFTQGSLILIAGDPGIGKSTLILQTAGKLCAQGKKVLYVSAEESGMQVKLRAQRLDINTNSLYVYPQTNLDAVLNQIDALKPDFLVIDSIQTVYMPDIAGSSGNISQIKGCVSALMEIAKGRNITVIVIGHVTKDGSTAGPKTLEHMVDTVIHFEGDRYKFQRILRAVKNRFGASDEIGVFNMAERGLEEIDNPSGLFMQERDAQAAPGSVIIAANEGTRVLLVEVQALTGSTFYPSPRRAAVGIDYNRLFQITAVLEKRIGINLSRQDVYVNAAGGIEINEPAADLGIALAITSCFRTIPIRQDCAIIGEVSLSGGIRSVSSLEKRIYEAQKLGFKRVIAPKPLNKKISCSDFDIEVIEVSRLMDAVKHCFADR